MPRLEKRGYPRGFTAALVTNASVLGLLIPPSGLMILYAWSAGQSVLASFLATVIPGIIVATLLIIINLIYFRNKDLKEINQITPQKEDGFMSRSVAATPGLLMPVIILGGIYGGIMTPTEAAAIAVVYAIPVGFWVYKGLNRKSFLKELVHTATTTGTIMIMLFGIMILSRIFVMENLPEKLTEILFSITENKILLILMVNIFLIILGMLMDDASAMLLATPILLPVVTNLGIDPIHFAAIIGVNLGMGTVTPPTAPLLYLGVRVGKAPLNEMIGPTVVMIIFAWLPTIILTTYIPELSLFLPQLLLD